MKTRKAIVMPDIHAPWEHRPSLKCLLDAVRIIKPDTFICIGDIGEFTGASHWEWKKKKRPPLEYQLAAIDWDISIVNDLMDTLDATCKKAKVKNKIMIQGNHDKWLDNVVIENPHLSRTKHEYGSGYKFYDAIGLFRRGWEYYPNEELCKIGHLYLYHGNMYGGVHHARNHLVKMGVNVMYGHYHDCQQASLTHVDGEKSAWSIGCLKRMDSEANQFMQGRPCNWSHAFAEVTWFGDNFSVNIHRIIKGKVVIHGELLDGN